MIDNKDTKPGEPTPEQIGAFMAELLKGKLGTQPEGRDEIDVSYANNFIFEPSVWDLKLMFGQLGQHDGVAEVDWHTEITIPWLQAKLVAYFLRLQAAWNELQNGYVNIPASVMPKEPEPPTEEQAKNPINVEWYQTAKKIYDETFGRSDAAPNAEGDRHLRKILLDQES